MHVLCRLRLPIMALPPSYSTHHGTVIRLPIWNIFFKVA